MGWGLREERLPCCAARSASRESAAADSSRELDDDGVVEDLGEALPAYHG